jgi:hypothetical protein
MFIGVFGIDSLIGLTGGMQKRQSSSSLAE